MNIIVKGHEFFYDISSMLLLFFPGSKAEYVDKCYNKDCIRSFLIFKNNKHVSITKVRLNSQTFVAQKTVNTDCDIKNVVKYTFYKACEKATKITSPWGILTGISPLSVYKKLVTKTDDVNKTLKEQYLVTQPKIDILSNIFLINNKFVTYNKKDISIYVSIPFCPSKCSYCSFISLSAVNKEKLLQQYVQLLCCEIEQKAPIISKFNLNIKSLYIGGGTPGILSYEQLKKLLLTLNKQFDLSSIPEKCFEIGRPDTVDCDKFELLNLYGFDRICINTQTTNDTILQKVNRNHTSKQYFNAVKLAKNYNFKSINTDLIAGLPGESVDSFKKSIDDIISSGVDNITIHTLAIKRAANLSDDKQNYNANRPDVDVMLNYAYSQLNKHGFVPYYLYRQKNCLANGENIGFCKPDTPCLYNIYMMESIHSVLAFGAGASTKIVNGTNIERVINIKYPMDYVREFDKINDNYIKINKQFEKVFENE